MSSDIATPPSVEPAARPAFEVHLDNFTGPFELLLGLIAKHQLDVTEVALSQVTDEFIGYIARLEGSWELGTASEFLVVAATLLDLKAARLLPRGEVEDEDDLALLEARDLLFARLLQYRAYREAAGWLDGRFATQGRRYPRQVGLEDRYARLFPEVVLGVGADAFAALAGRALAPKPAPQVPTDHVHAPAVDMVAETQLVCERLAAAGTTSFRGLADDAGGPLVVVARFLILLDLYRDGRVGFDQVTPLGELTIRWIATP